MKIEWKSEWKMLAWILGSFLFLYLMPLGTQRFDNAVFEALYLTQWYAQEHVILCLIPAFFIAGAISVFVRKEAVLKYLGPKASKPIAYGVGSVSGSIWAVCSCTVLPLFSGIYRMGAGLGPAIAFLYSGPAINVLALILTARIIGLELGLARMLGAIVFSIVIGGIMQYIYRKEESAKGQAAAALPDSNPKRALWQDALFFTTLVAILIFANWGGADEPSGSIWYLLYSYKWWLTSLTGLALGIILILWFAIAWWKLFLLLMPVIFFSLLFPENPALAFSMASVGLAVILSFDDGEAGEWLSESWDFAKQITPLLLGGVLISGLLLGRPGFEGVIPSVWVEDAVGGNTLAANFFASIVGAFMYFATLTEVPIVQSLLGSGMGQGPALSLLLAGPALSLPSMLVIASYIGWGKTFVYCTLVVIMATFSGYIYGMWFM